MASVNLTVSKVSGPVGFRGSPSFLHETVTRHTTRTNSAIGFLTIVPLSRLEDFLADVHSAVDAIGRLNPIHFANSDFPQLSFSTIAELDVGVRDLAIEEAVNRDGQVHGGGRPDGGKSGRADDFGGALALL